MLVDNMIYRISISRSLYTNDGFKEPPDEDNLSKKPTAEE